jgi:biofilm PGA synthesis N-glycosyltransferase PgaC
MAVFVYNYNYYMEVFNQIFIYLALFVGLYFQVFMILTYFVWPKKEENLMITDPILLPTVSIIVPCFNEGNTVEKTMYSLLALDYPKEKLDIVVIDDGSTDNTWEVVQQFKDNPQVRLFHKENEGSKFAALNFALDLISTEIVGCLDADSSVDSQALRHSVQFFKNDENVSAVIPAMTIDNPKNILQYMQKVEYEMITFSKKVFHDLESIYVAPGPFALFRKEVFDTLGYYKEAHHTEDLEIALRMQVNGMRIVHAPDSLVYTHGPKTWPTLLKQRIRWTYGGFKNILSDYRHMMFKKEYGNLSRFILPFAMLSNLITIIAFPFLIWGIVSSLYTFGVKLVSSGFTVQAPAFDLFYISNQSYGYLSLLLLAITFMIIYISRRSILRTRLLSFDLLTFFVYPFFASWWMIYSAYNFITSKKSAWR